MVHTGIFATSDEIIVKAGEYYDTSVTEARINALCLQAESFINISTRYNWTDAFSGLNADVKYILSMLESDIVAMYIIDYNLANYPSRDMAETMLDVLNDKVRTNIELLKDIKVQDFITNA